MFAWLTRTTNRIRSWLKSLCPGLNSKLSLLIIFVSLIGVLASAALILTLQRQQLEETALQATNRLSAAINSSLEQAMLRNDRAMMSEIIRAMVDKQSIEHIEILDNAGNVHVSSVPSEVGQRFTYAMPTCQFCHTGDARPSNQSAIVETKDAHTALLNVNLIYNQPQCQSCHPPQDRILGLTIIELPLDDLNNQMASSFWRIVVAALLTLGLLISLMTLALRRMIIQPIDALTQGMTQIRDGNLEDGLVPASHDEFGKLASAFDDMRRQLRATRLENATLNKQMRSMAILEERDRLARELHDNLAQMLGYINIKAALADEQLTKEQTAQVHASLLELKQVAKEAYTDVRESIFYLRSPMPAPNGLLENLRAYLAEYRARYGIETYLWIEDERCIDFPGEVEVQVNRIVQEALTNVRKHAQARQACVRFGHTDHHVRIQIEDNGVGFDSAKIGQDGRKHFGLQIMRERAASIGGELEIDSQRDAGTRVNLIVPFYSVDKEVNHAA